ncbi:DUF418 domain-containing protein [Bacillus ndiopicus]|uniref:DUF418 domain-containing protein n=1 Tax=Bacillus ndiopicus TaxID=1347368 RepID=UPI0005A65A4B|nr:DUF418 domain-containing protein [Bacillus ndiopicus]
MEKTKGRIHVIDGIRGFSLFGILSANMLIFQYSINGSPTMDMFTMSGLDEWMNHFIAIAITGSFMPIFAFLFGYSMIMMSQSLENKGLKVKWHLFKRSLFLIIIGLLHGIFLWEGDILFSYGTLMLILILFVRRKAKTVLIWAISTWVITFAFIGLGSFVGGGVEEISNPQSLQAYMEKTVDIYGSGTYQEIKEHRNNAELIEEDEPVLFLAVFVAIFMLPIFLMGIYAAKKQWFVQMQGKGRRYGLLAGVLIFLGITLKALAELGPSFSFTDFGQMIGTFILAFGYIFLIAALYNQAWFSNKMQWFEAVGKLSLTNYLLQSVICTTIFYGYGFGLFGKLGVTLGFVLGIVIYLLQLIASRYYLTHFQAGPMEKLIRTWTYFSFKRKKKHRTLNENV